MKLLSELTLLDKFLFDQTMDIPEAKSVLSGVDQAMTALKIPDI